MNPFKDKFTRAIRHLALALLASFMLISCGGGGGGENSDAQPVTQATIIVTTINDPTVPVIAVAADKDWKERITLVGDKDTAGTPVNLSEVHYSVLGIDVKIELGVDGLPSVVSDQVGNKYTLTNYTSSTVDITYFDNIGELIVGPKTIQIDSEKLALLKNRNIQAGLFDSLTMEDWLKWGGNTVDIGLCVTGAASIFVGTAAIGTPLAIVLGASCITTAASYYTLINDVNDKEATKYFAVATGANLGLDIILGNWGSASADIASLALNYVGTTIISANIAESTPTIPTNIRIMPIKNSIKISWSGSTNDSAVSGYKIIRDNNISFNSSTAFYEDTTVLSGTTYCYEVVAIGLKYESAKSVSQCAIVSNLSPPVVITAAATNITPASVTLNGRVNPNGTLTNANFEYGTSTSYGQQTQLLTAMNGSSFINMTENLYNLTPNSKYHYRVVAMNAEGSVTTGSDQTFQSVVPIIAAPTIANVFPETVTGSNSAQAFTINGSNFVTGANITLRDKSTGEVFPNRQSSNFTNTRITLNTIFKTAPGMWSVNVVNPDNSSTGEYVFSVLAPTGGPLSFTSLNPNMLETNAIGYQPTLTASGSNFINLKQISFNWSGVTNGNSTWINGDINWLRKVIVNSDGSMIFKPVVTQTGDPAGVTNWTVTLTDTAGMTVTKTFTVNYVSTTVTPDLQVLSGTVSPTSVSAGGAINASWAIYNQGTGTASASTTVVRINQSTTSSAGSNLATISTNSLMSGGSQSQSANLTAPTTAGTYYVWVIADNLNTAGQSTSAAANDLVRIGSFTVAAAATAPDLQVLSGTVSPTSVSAGGAVNASWAIYNQGTGTANASTTVVRINQSTTSSAGSNLATISTNSLMSGGSQSQSANLTAPTTAGTYYVWVIADNLSTAGQSTSAAANDLVRIGSFTVAAAATAPDLQVLNGTVSPTAVSAGARGL